LRDTTRASLIGLHEGVSSVLLVDFPDHGNVGDSAIALGEQLFWQEAGIDLRAVYSRATLPSNFSGSSGAVAVHGGGNLGGLYPSASTHRYGLARRLRAEVTLIQEPQTVFFTEPREKEVFAQSFGQRANTRLAVRDLVSLAAVADVFSGAVLSPDPVHMLGKIESAAATREKLVVMRRDGESAGRALQGADWPADPRDLNRLRWWANRSRRIPPLRKLFHRGPTNWMNRAQRRFDQGVEFLSQGETIHTDRLHVMLMALQMGRKVIAYDNNYGKLSSYARTWLAPFEDSLTLVPGERPRAEQ
jgi:pyruvyl transferase EpsO